MNKPRILVVEDDDFQYEIYEDALEAFELVRAVSASEALAAIHGNTPHLILLDHILAEGDLGLGFLPEFKELLPHVPVVVVSGALEVQQQMLMQHQPIAPPPAASRFVIDEPDTSCAPYRSHSSTTP